MSASARLGNWRVARPASWVLIAVGLAFASACHTPPIADGERRSIDASRPLTIEEARARIEAAAAAEGWRIRAVRAGRSLLSISWDLRIARCVIDYDEDSFSIRYLGSVNLESPEGEMPRAYHRRVARLVRRIEAESRR